uniref:Uncharacterized protein n=1 Tax=Arundo donax TaxID=35708 RepID=A0A0A8ZDL5_ARUDO
MGLCLIIYFLESTQTYPRIRVFEKMVYPRIRMALIPIHVSI